jgi:hypothetical protein
MKEVRAMNLTNEQKLIKYKNGEYRFDVPPVCTGNWDDQSWVKWIDSCDGWIGGKPRARYEAYSETIRSVPENYCLAVRHRASLNRWISYDDAACKKYYPKIQRLIDKHGKVSTNDQMAAIIAKHIPKKHGYSFWQ